MTRLDSARAIEVLAAHDDAYQELTRALYGGDVAPAVVWADVFAKSNPGPADVHVPMVVRQQVMTPGSHRRDQRQRVVGAGLSAVGATAGVAGLAYGARQTIREGRKVTPDARPVKAFRTGWPRADKFTRALVPLEVAGLGGEVMATRILHRDVRENSRRPPAAGPIVKAGIGELAAGYATQARQLVRRLVPAGTGRHRTPFTGGPAKPHTAPGGAGKAKPNPAQHTLFDIGGKPSPEGATVGSQRGQEAGYRAGQAVKTATATPARKAAVAGGAVATAGVAAHEHRAQRPPEYPGPSAYYYSKRSERDVEVEWAGTFSKFDTDKRLAFGWASMSKVDGLPVIDRQNDIILAEDIEDAVYAYVVGSRVGGDMHDRVGLFGKAQPGSNPAGVRPGLGLWEQSGTDSPRKVADLVESMMFTDEKIEKMGLPETFPRGWWVGFRYHDDDVWAAIKDGRRTGFSIHGKGLREPVDADELMYGAVA